MLALAFVPTFAVAVGARRIWVACTRSPSTLAACCEVFHTPVTERAPGGEHDFFGPVLGSFRDGFLNFYDTTLPFQPRRLPAHARGRAPRRSSASRSPRDPDRGRRPIGAAVVLVVGVGWPTTLVPGSRPLLVGALALGGVLAVLFLLRSGTHPAGASRRESPSRSCSSPAPAAARPRNPVAKGGAFLTWQAWIRTTSPTNPSESATSGTRTTSASLPEEEDDRSEGPHGGPRSGASTGARRLWTTTRAPGWQESST
jgi:hypothetical protein